MSTLATRHTAGLIGPAWSLLAREWLRFLRQRNRILGALGTPLLFWVFFGVGFVVMAVMIVSVFRAIWEGKKEREIWKGLSGKSSLLQK